MATSNPRIVSRGEWGANPLTTPASNISIPTRDLWLHHTGGNNHGASGMRSLQNYARSNGYVDLEYSLCVDTDGQIYMSRGIGKDSAATGGNNSTSHAICAMGNYENDQVTDRLLDSIASATLWLHANGGIQSARITGPHRDAPGNSTACCGRNLIARIGDINNIIAGGGVVPPKPKPPEEEEKMSDMAQATNHDGRPVVFQVGNDKKLYMRIRDATGGNWSSWRDLSGGKTDFGSVTAFETPFKNATKIEIWATCKSGTFQRWQSDDFASWGDWVDRSR